MFYCVNCNNLYDISKTATSSNTTTQTDTQSQIETQTQIETQAAGAENYAEIINNILTSKKVQDSILKDKNAIKNITDSNFFKKLSSEQKETVYNLLLVDDTINLDDKNNTNNNSKNVAFFVCTNCGHSEKIKPHTKIFTKQSEEVSKNYSSNQYVNMKNSSILPRTRMYDCPNNSCKSYESSKYKEAVIIRQNNSFGVVYVCTACDAVF